MTALRSRRDKAWVARGPGEMMSEVVAWSASKEDWSGKLKHGPSKAAASMNKPESNWRLALQGDVTMAEETNTQPAPNSQPTPDLFTDPTLGQIVAYAGMLTDPRQLEWLRRNGWLPCDGSSHPDALYPQLSRLIKGIYGQGDQANEFRLPNLCGRVPIGTHENHPLAEAKGEEVVILKPENLPPHQHRYIWPDGRGNDYSEKCARGVDQKINRGPAKSDGGPGQSQPFSIMQPYLALNYLIRADRPSAVTG